MQNINNIIYKKKEGENTNHKYRINKIIEYEILCKIELISWLLFRFRFQSVLVLPGSGSNRFQFQPVPDFQFGFCLSGLTVPVPMVPVYGSRFGSCLS